MWLALRFEPNRFFLKGKIDDIDMHTNLTQECAEVWKEHKRRRHKKQSHILILGPDKVGIRREYMKVQGEQEFIAERRTQDEWKWKSQTTRE